MNSPKLSRIIIDGFNSDVGSTKRTRAKNVLSVLDKVKSNKSKGSNQRSYNTLTGIYNQVASGQGGPGPSVPKVLKRVPSPRADVSLGYKNPDNAKGGVGLAVGLGLSGLAGLSFPALAKWRSDIYNKKKGIDMGAQWTPSDDILSKYYEEKGIDPTPKKSPTHAFPWLWKRTKEAAFIPEYGARLFSTYASPQLGAFGSGLLNLLHSDWGTSFKDQKADDFVKKIQEREQKREQKMKMRTMKILSPNEYEQMQKDIEISGKLDELKAQKKKEEEKLKNSESNEEKAEVKNKIDEINEEINNVVKELESNPLAGTQLEGMWKTLPQSVKDAYYANLSPGIFADNMMANRDALRELYPSVADQDLPYGAGLVGQVESLAKRLRESHGLEELYYKYENLLKNGYTLEEDLYDYATKRDTFVKNVDAMIEKVREDAVYGSADPASVRSRDSYIDYLGTLKNRQTIRYVDLIDKSLNLYDAKMKGITELYNKKHADYAYELEEGVKITVNRYNEMREDLISLWTLVSSGQELAANYANAKLEELRALISIETGNLSEKDDNKSGYNKDEYNLLINDFKNIGDADGKILPEYTLSNLYDKAQTIGTGPGETLDAMKTLINNQSSNSDKKRLLDKFKGSKEEAHMSMMMGEEPGAVYNYLYGELYGQLFEGTMNSISKKDEEDITSALKKKNQKKALKKLKKMSHPFVQKLIDMIQSEVNVINSLVRILESEQGFAGLVAAVLEHDEQSFDNTY